MLSVERFKSYFEGKSVALVGDDVFLSSPEPNFANHDIVICSWWNWRNHGTKADFLFLITTLNSHATFLVDNDSKCGNTEYALPMSTDLARELCGQSPSSFVTVFDFIVNQVGTYRSLTVYDHPSESDIDIEQNYMRIGHDPVEHRIVWRC